MLAALHPARKSWKGQAVETNVLSITATALGMEVKNEAKDFSMSGCFYVLACCSNLVVAQCQELDNKARQ